MAPRDRARRAGDVRPKRLRFADWKKDRGLVVTRGELMSVLDVIERRRLQHVWWHRLLRWLNAPRGGR